ncbi:DUF262 domain-containing protein [Enterococcus faecalis]|uniref:DUF262 domain-containing protein n=1 Tax=Enterococcus faecalis TaxID=1351 RepID=UPI0021AFF151|nr:DUF262 domain-containing protein [Enterococcus faecalis]
MKEISLVEEKNEDESISNDELFNISSWGADLSFREIIMMYDEGELLKPELQRNYVWTKLEASRFIDSILLGLPVPSIFFAKVEDEKKLIIDGYQRIMTVYDFVKGVFSGNNQSFKLSNSEAINKRWRNKTFVELTEDEQIRIRATTIHAIIFEQKQPRNDSGMYQIFERINTGGKTLKSQEIRNCIYQGDMNSILIELNKEEIWRKILQNDKLDSRMLDIELILRFFSISHLYSNTPDTHTINLTNYLNWYMSDKKKMNEGQIKKLTQIFIDTMNLVFEIFNDLSFRKSTNINRKIKVNPVIFDAVSVATLRVIENKLELASKEAILDRYGKLFLDEEFIDMISKRTTNIDNIIGRINKVYVDVYGGKI